MRCRVHPVDVGESPHLVRLRADLFHLGSRADQVARRRDGDEPCPLRKQAVVLACIKLAARGVDLGEANERARARRGLNPGPNVRIVVQPRHDDFVALSPASRQHLCQAVGERCHVRPEDHTRRLASHEVGDGDSAGLDNVSRPPTGGEGPTYVAEACEIGARDRRDDARRNLGAGSAVKVRVAVGERGITGPDPRYIEGQCRTTPARGRRLPRCSHPGRVRRLRSNSGGTQATVAAR